MAIALPNYLAGELRYLGYAWPASDETGLQSNADLFGNARPRVQAAVAEISDALEQVRRLNSPQVADSFLDYMFGPESNLASLKDFDQALEAIELGYREISAAVVALKSLMIAQLTILAIAAQLTHRTAGRSVAINRLLRAKARFSIDLAISLAIEVVSGDPESETDEADETEAAEPGEQAATAPQLSDSSQRSWQRRIEALLAELAAAKTAGRVSNKLLQKLADAGDQLQLAGDVASAMGVWQQAVDSLGPNPVEHEMAMWFFASIADAQFELQQFAQADATAAQALLAGGDDNGFVWLRKGQALIELASRDAGIEALTSAYLLEGDEIFEDEDPKYRQLLVEAGVIAN